MTFIVFDIMPKLGKINSHKSQFRRTFLFHKTNQVQWTGPVLQKKLVQRTGPVLQKKLGQMDIRPRFTNEICQMKIMSHFAKRSQVQVIDRLRFGKEIRQILVFRRRNYFFIQVIFNQNLRFYFINEVPQILRKFLLNVSPILLLTLT